MSHKLISRCLIVIFVVTLIPLLVIARYNFPCADDFSYGNYTISTWQNTHSPISTIKAAVNGTQTVYQTWQGSFVAVFLMTLHPAIFGESFYFLVPAFLLLFFIFSVFFLFKVIMVRYWGADLYHYRIIATVFSFLSIQFVLSPVEAFYWYNGGMYYTGFTSLSFIMFGMLLMSMKSSRQLTKISTTIAATLMAFLIGGSNFVTALTSFVVLGLFTCYSVFKKQKFLSPICCLLAISLSLVISIIAPGNAVRQEHFQSMNPVLSVLMSFWYALMFIVHFVRIPVYFGISCIVPTLYQVAKDSNFSFRLPGLVSILLYGVFASTFTPNLYSMSSFGMARVMNVNHYAFLLFLCLTIFYWCGWLARKISLPTNLVKKTGKSKDNPNSMLVPMVSILAGCFIFGCIIIVDMNINAMTSVSAAYSLFSGEAEQYGHEQSARLDVYRDPNIDIVEVSSLSVKPYVLFFDDITPNPDDWRNTNLATYYHKQLVVLKEGEN